MRAKNDNLITYRKKQRTQNEQLINRAIEHILKLNGDVSFSMVSKVTYDIANAEAGEDGISLAGISKNKLYRGMVEKAKASHSLKTNQTERSIKSLSVGDIQMSMHSLRIELAKLKKENRVLSQMLEIKEPKKELIEGVPSHLIERAKELRKAGKNMIERLLELELVYIDKQAQTLCVAMYGDVVIPNGAFGLFFEKDENGAF